MCKQYVKIDGKWMRVYPKDTWKNWVVYSMTFALCAATVGIVLW